MIDLRSDTVTRPTPAMRAAMAAAEVGDDVFGADPTVNALQRRVAEQLGYEDALFMPSGTQSNLCALMSHCERGDEYIVGQMAHTYRWEGGGAAVLGSIQPQPLSHQADGTLALADIAAAIKPDDDHFARSRLLALENTLGGRVMPPQYLVEATALARAHGLATHLDGARLFNAAVALAGVGGDPWAEAKRMVSSFDSVSLCFSKGLGAPIGSMLCGSKAFIRRAHRWRKVCGGGLRQVGVLAAAADHALTHHVARLSQDHAHARRLAEGLANIPGVVVVAPETNIVFVDLPEAFVRSGANAVQVLGARGLLCTGERRLRLVTHLDVSASQIESALDIFRETLQ
jgi:threonine aldolase